MHRGRGRRSSAAVEVGGLVGLDPVDDLGLRRVRVDLAGGRDRGPPSPPPASASRARGSRPRRGRRRPGGPRARRAARVRSASRRSPSASVPSSQVVYSSTATLAASDGPLEAAALRRPSTAPSAAATISSKKVGQLGGGLDLDALPGPDLRHRPRGCAPGRGTPGRPRAGRRSPPAARRGGRGRGRTGGTARRRSCRGRATGAPRCAARPCRRWLGGRCGAPGRARSGRSPTGRLDRGPRPAVRWRRSAVELVEDRLPPAVAELVVERVQAEGRAEDRVVADQPAQARLDEVVERVVARPAVGRVGGARQVGRERRVGQGSAPGSRGRDGIAAGGMGRPADQAVGDRRSVDATRSSAARSRPGPRASLGWPSRCRRPRRRDG